MEHISIPLHCRACPYVAPYLDDIRNLENKQIDSITKNILIQYFDFSEEDIELAIAENELAISECNDALNMVYIRTIGCMGVILANDDIYCASLSQNMSNE